MHLVKELLQQMNRSQDQINALKQRIRKESEKRSLVESALKRIKKSNRDMQIKCSRYASVTEEVTSPSIHWSIVMDSGDPRKREGSL